MPVPGLPIHTALSAIKRQALARRERRQRVVPGLYAIAHVLHSTSRAEATRVCGRDWQALRDAVVRLNVKGGSDSLPDEGDAPCAS